MHRRKTSIVKPPYNIGQVILEDVESIENFPVIEVENDSLKNLQRKPIEGYTVPTKIITGNNKAAIYSTYKNSGKKEVVKSSYKNAYSIKPCVLCENPIDKCIC
jgi:hypothetical protein